MLSALLVLFFAMGSLWVYGISMGMLWECYGSMGSLWECYGSPIPRVVMVVITHSVAMGRCYGEPITHSVAMGRRSYGPLLWDGAPICCYGTEHPYVAMGPTPLLVARAVAMGGLLWGLRTPLCCYAPLCCYVMFVRPRRRTTSSSILPAPLMLSVVRWCPSKKSASLDPPLTNLVTNEWEHLKRKLSSSSVALVHET